MSGLMQGLEIARRALLAQQAALNVTGNNLANMATPGYTRQSAILVATPSERTPEGILGTGVSMDGIQRARDVFIDRQIRSELGLAGRWQSRSDLLSRVEDVIQEPSDVGLASLLDEFWNSWLDLSNQPEDAAARAVVVQRGQSLAEGFRQEDSRLEGLMESADADLDQRISHLNTLLSEVASLNSQIADAEVGGGIEANLRDSRDQILDELARAAGATSSQRADGTAVVRMAGRTVVDGETATPLAIQRVNDGGQLLVNVLFGSDKTPPAYLSGELAGVLEVRNTILPEFCARLDTLAQALADSVNRLHEAGPSRVLFFRGNSAATLEVTPEVANDPSQVNAGSTGDAGDNDIALAIAGLQDARLIDRGTASISSGYRSLVAGLGSLGQQAQAMSESQDAAVQSLEARRQSVVGVNLDEELTHMVSTQKAYQAAARVFSTVEQMLDVLLNM
jgi:flagellar hook-associated protein 1 FlgK